MDVEALVVLVVLVCGLNPAGNGPSKVNSRFSQHSVSKRVFYYL